MLNPLLLVRMSEVFWSWKSRSFSCIFIIGLCLLLIHPLGAIVPIRSGQLYQRKQPFLLYSISVLGSQVKKESVFSSEARSTLRILTERGRESLTGVKLSKPLICVFSSLMAVSCAASAGTARIA